MFAKDQAFALKFPQNIYNCDYIYSLADLLCSNGLLGQTEFIFSNRISKF